MHIASNAALQRQFAAFLTPELRKGGEEEALVCLARCRPQCAFLPRQHGSVRDLDAAKVCHILAQRFRANNL